MTCAIHAQIPAGRPAPVTVNGVTIPRDAIQREMQHHPASKPIAAWQQAARALVVRELLLQRARHLGLAAESLSDAEGRRETEDEALMRGVVEREVTLPEPDDDTCRRYYERNQARFRSPDIYEVSHILFAALPSDSDAHARAKDDADTVLATLKAAPGRFAELARAHSQCPSAAQGGNLGQITRGQTTPEFEQALLALEPGALCAEPIVTRYGFHIIRLERKTAGQVLPFEAAAGRIADYLRDNVQRRASAQYIARLASAATVTGIDMPGAAEHRVY